MRYANSYKYMNKEYKSLDGVLREWDKNGANRFYSIYIGKNRYEATYITIEQLDKYLKENNSCYTYYINSNTGYGYRNANKINFNQLDKITIRNCKGYHGHITNAFTVVYFNGKLVKLD